MMTTKDQPSEPTGTKLTKKIYEQALTRWRGQNQRTFARILREDFNVTDYNPYEYYYGYNWGID